jgi:hypothetical protein
MSDSNNNNNSVELDEEKLVESFTRRLANVTKLKQSSSEPEFRHWGLTFYRAFRTSGTASVVFDENEFTTSDVKIKAQLTKSSSTSENKEENKEVKTKSAIELQHDEIRMSAAYTVMMNFIDVALFTTLQNMHEPGDARELYKLLKKHFTPVTEFSCFRALLQLTKVKQLDTESFPEFGNRIKGLWAKIAQFDNLAESLQVFAFYQGMKPEYQEKLNDKLSSDRNYTLNKAIELMESYADVKSLSNKNNNNLGAESVFQARHQNQNQYPNSNGFNARSNTNSQNNGKQKQTKYYCHSCKTNTHNWERCYDNPDNPKNKLKQSTATNSQSNKKKGKKQFKFAGHVSVVNNSIAIVDSDTSNSNSATNESVLILDSGASAHICNELNLLSNIRTIDPVQVRVANGESIYCSKVGEVLLGPLKHPESHDEITIQLSDVLYSEKFSANLVSVPRLSEKGFRVSFGPKQNHAVIVPPNCDDIEILCENVNGVYQIRQRFQSTSKANALVVLRNPNAHNCQVNEIISLHNRLGHLHSQGLAKLIREKAAEGLPEISVSEVNNIIRMECKHCDLGKSHQSKFSAETKQQPATEVLHRVHCDITGPIKMDGQVIQSINRNNANNNYQYYSVIIDEYSGMIFGRALVSKADTISHVIEEITRLENLTEKKLKYFHSDGGGEYNSNNLIQFLQKKGVTKTTTTPNTPQHNGAAERSMRTIFETARTLLIQCGLPLQFWVQAVDTAIYIYNRVTVKRNGKTPYELFHGLVVMLSFTMWVITNSQVNCSVKQIVVL